MEKILNAAIIFNLKGTSHKQVLTGETYNSILALIIGNNLLPFEDESMVFGFMTDHFRFVDRREAVYVAKAAGQVSIDFNKNKLAPEDLFAGEGEEDDE